MKISLLTARRILTRWNVRSIHLVVQPLHSPDGSRRPSYRKLVTTSGSLSRMETGSTSNREPILSPILAHLIIHVSWHEPKECPHTSRSLVLAFAALDASRSPRCRPIASRTPWTVSSSERASEDTAVRYRIVLEEEHLSASVRQSRPAQQS